MLKTLENYQDEAAAAFYVDRAVVRIKAAVKSQRFQTAYLEAQSKGNDQVNLLMLGFLDVEEIQARWNDERLGEILVAATYIITQPQHRTSETSTTLKKFWKRPAAAHPAHSN